MLCRHWLVPFGWAGPQALALVGPTVDEDDDEQGTPQRDGSPQPVGACLWHCA